MSASPAQPSTPPSPSPSPSDMEQVGPLDEVVAYIDVRSSDGQIAVDPIAERLGGLGASISKTFSSTVTHVVFKDGSNSTLRKLRALKAVGKREIHAVNVLWVDSCLMQRAKCDEKDYTIDTATTPPGKKAARSMKPRSVAESTSNVTARKEASKRKSIVVEETQFPDDSGSDSDAGVDPTPPKKRSKLRLFALPGMADSPASKDVVEETQVDLGAASDEDTQVSVLSNRTSKGADNRTTHTEHNTHTEDGEFLSKSPTRRSTKKTYKAKKASLPDSSPRKKSPPARSSASTGKTSSTSTRTPERNSAKTRENTPAHAADSPRRGKNSASKTATKEKPRKSLKSDTQKKSCRRSGADSALKDRSNISNKKNAVKTQIKSTAVKVTPKRFVISGLQPSMADCVISSIKQFPKCTIDEFVTERTTHVISGGVRTMKVLAGISRGCWIVDPSFALSSLEAGKWLSETDFEMTELFPGASVTRCEKKKIGKAYTNKIFSTDTVGSVFFSDKQLQSQILPLTELSGLKVSSSIREADTLIGLDAARANGRRALSEKWIFDSVMNAKLQSKAAYVL